MPQNSLFGAVARSRCAMAGLIALCISAVRPAQADIIDISADLANRLNGVGDFTGTIEYQNSIDSSGTLIITLTNTLPVHGGYITGVVFNIDSSDPNAKAKLTSAPPKFRNAPNQNVNPFGSPYDAGAALRGHFMGGGNYRKGIAPGQTKSFTFNVIASDAALLNAEDFLSGPYDYNFLVRFRGGHGGSDVVPAQGFVVPGPSALTFLALITALSSWRRRANA